MNQFHKIFPLLSRRKALGVLSTAGAGIVLLPRKSPASYIARARAMAATADACVQTPTVEMGPYFADDGIERSDVTTGNSSNIYVADGVPLTLNLTFLNYSSGGCTALTGARIDIWSANANGVYSDTQQENTIGYTWLRGYQVTDSNGDVTFKTIYPGWYTGRTVHIHIMVRMFDSSGNNTYEWQTQLYFDQTVTNAIMENAPYNTRGDSVNTTNSEDNRYTSETQLTLSGSAADGYTAAFTIGAVGASEDMPSTAITLTPSATSITSGQNITLTAAVTSSSSSSSLNGEVTFKCGSYVVAQLSLQTSSKATGSVTLSSSGVAAGTYPIVASYSGDTAHSGSVSSAVKVTIEPLTPTVALSASPTSVAQGGSVTLTAKVTGSGSTPTGSVTFTSNGVTIGTASLSSGAATYTASSSGVAKGSYPVIAHYGGNGFYSAEASSAVTVTVT